MASTKSLKSLPIWIAIFSLVKILGEHISHHIEYAHFIRKWMAWSLSQSFVFTVIFFKSKMTGYIWLGLKSQNLSLNLRKFLYFIWKTFLCFNNFKNLFSGRKSHQNEDGFFFLSFFFFVYHAQVDTCDSGNSWLISFIRSTFWKISKKIIIKV